jgi:hypothetical protein
MAIGAEGFGPVTLPWRRITASPPRWCAAAWTAIMLVMVFVAATCWWLSQDRSIPVYDAGFHLSFAIDVYEDLGSGRVLKALTVSVPYPPLTYLVGALGIVVGGVGVAPPIIALNIVFVPLLALGCYRIGRLAFNPLTGLLAVVFALGSPFVIEEFHEFMLDAPEAAMVAVAVWAILATERFSRPRVSALAGIAVGLGMLTKETFVFFVVAVALATAVRGGRGGLRGVAIFASVALVIALPWHIYEFSTLHKLEGIAFATSGHISNLPVSPGVAPPRLSRENLEWYFWSFVNRQLLVPLFIFFALGWMWTMIGFVWRRPVSRFAPELAIGAFVSWAILTETYFHDLRYGIPLLIYLAVFGASWVTRLPRAPRIVAATVLVLVALVNSIGIGFGVGRSVRVVSVAAPDPYYQEPGNFTIFATRDFWIGGPTHDGDMLGLLRALHSRGVKEVRLYSEKEGNPAFSPPGIAVLARLAGLRIASNSVNPFRARSSDAFFHNGPIEGNVPTPCVVLWYGAGVWIRLGGPREDWSYCPHRQS